MVYLQTSMSSPGFESRSNDTAFSIKNDYTRRGRRRLADLDDRAKLLGIICQKCTDLLSNYRRSELQS
ncbi:hypothetical protein TNCV_1281491 [Trichonephila clavipes]|nr:hypothetical protein TNCV_1281491 [Trichonephila clavipes]